MHASVIISAILVVIFSTTNASFCRPVLCMIACRFGFDVDENGCEICSCRKTPNTCVEPIMGYNCGIIDHRDCPGSHECQLSLDNLIGQCCLKPRVSTTTARSPTGTSAVQTTTSRPATGTSAGLTTTVPPTSTYRPLFMMLAAGHTGSSQASTTRRPATTTPHRTGSPSTSTRRF